MKSSHIHFTILVRLKCRIVLKSINKVKRGAQLTPIAIKTNCAMRFINDLLSAFIVATIRVTQTE